MQHDSEKYHRRSIRLKGYDYSSPGGYFITVCAHKRECAFGKISLPDVGARPAAPDLNPLGHIVKQCWADIPSHFPHVLFDEYVVMPSHIHGILIISGVARDEGKNAVRRAPTLSAIVGSFKSASSKEINEIRKRPDVPLWQRNYYEHVVRDEDDLNRIRQYIYDNPANWAMDVENPNNRGHG
jgi:REP element-mobilizing transposase RayT